VHPNDEFEKNRIQSFKGTLSTRQETVVKKSTQTIQKRKTKRKTPTPKPSLLANSEPINPNFFYRKPEGWKFFGYRLTQLDLKISEGVVPTPIVLDGSPNGRARGWFGSTILKWQQDLIDAAAKAEAAKQAARGAAKQVA
jgi:hypothetical protein